jgi:hypothetical protein
MLNRELGLWHLDNGTFEPLGASAVRNYEGYGGGGGSSSSSSNGTEATLGWCSYSRARSEAIGCRGESHLTPHTSHTSHHTSHTTHHTSHTTPHTPHLTHHTSHTTPHTSHLTHHTSHLTPHTSHLTPHTPHITPHTPHLTPHTPHLTHHTSHLTPHTSHTTPHRWHPGGRHGPWQDGAAGCAGHVEPSGVRGRVLSCRARCWNRIGVLTDCLESGTSCHAAWRRG